MGVNGFSVEIIEYSMGVTELSVGVIKKSSGGNKDFKLG